MNIKNLIFQAQSIGEYFQILEEKKALLLFPQFTEELNMLYVEVTKLNNTNLYKNIISNLDIIFNSIVNSLKNQDYVYMGDIFIYELIPLLEQLENIG